MKENQQNDIEKPLLNSEVHQDQKQKSDEVKKKFEKGNLEENYQFYVEKTKNLRKKVIEISELINDQNKNLCSLRKDFENAKLMWKEKYYERCCCCSWEWCEFNWCCDCFQKCWHYYCCLKDQTKDHKMKIRIKEKEIKRRLKQIENLEEYLSLSEDKKKTSNKISYWFLLIFCIISIIHFVALSEVHGILLALLKEIVRTSKFYLKGHYDFKENDVIKTFMYYLTESNYHDSSQINFNYFSSMFTLLILKSLNFKYRISIMYLISLLVIFSFCSMLLAIDYLDEKQILAKKNYGGWKFTFCFVIPYLFIYTFAGFISLLPNKILIEIYEKEETTSKFIAYIVINIFIGLSVTAKNFFNYYCIGIFHFHFSPIANYVLSETLFFLIASIIYFLFLLIFNKRINGGNLTLENQEKCNNNNEEGKGQNIRNNIKNEDSVKVCNKEKDDDNKYDINSKSNKDDGIKIQSISNNCINNTDSQKSNDHNKENENDGDADIQGNDNKINNIDICSIFDDINSEKEKYIAKNNCDNAKYTIDYIGGYLVIRTDYIKTFIEIKGFWKYICTIFKNKKIILILFINFCSRLQKLKFKTEYKSRIKDFKWLFSNYLFSIIPYSFLFIFLYWIKKNNMDLSEYNKSFEIIIQVILILVFIYVLVCSIVFLLIVDRNNKNIDRIIYASISLTGSLNYFLYYYYSIQKEEFITLSGIISFSQLIFRLLEYIFEPFDKKNDYYWQIYSSTGGIVLSLSYLIYIKINE